jgi:hypothetical protein
MCDFFLREAVFFKGLAAGFPVGDCFGHERPKGRRMVKLL